MLMRLSEKESLSYLKDKGFEISVNHFYRLKRKIQESRFDRLSLIAKHGFVDQHLERIDQLELINKEYWKLYNETKDTFKKALILEKIAELQTYISPYYDASRYVMEQSIKKENETKENRSVSVL
jgi:DNA repair ATPase RecN